nr:unnamed protein product [Callosobruchus chinensis]
MVADHQPHFLCVTEHWLTSETISLFVPQGYKLVSSSCRNTGEHGGAAVYARLDVECRPADNITKMSKVPYLECAAAETVIGNEPYIIVSLYRPSNHAKDNMVMFFSLLYSICDFIFMKSAKPVLAGDFNIDILKDNTSKQNFTSVLNEYDLKTTVKAKVHYKTLKNQYVKLLQKSKSELIKNKIDSADNKSQAMWQIINKLTGKNNPSKIFPEGGVALLKACCLDCVCVGVLDLFLCCVLLLLLPPDICCCCCAICCCCCAICGLDTGTDTVCICCCCCCCCCCCWCICCIEQSYCCCCTVDGGRVGSTEF